MERQDQSTSLGKEARDGNSRGYGRGYSEPYGSSQRYNYPQGFRSGRAYDERGRSYDYGYGQSRYGQEGRYGEEGRWGREGEGRWEGERGWWDRASDEVASWFGDEEAERRRRMDEQRQYRGRGPKGYRRSDERIKEDINDRLTDDYSLDASDIEVSVDNGEVTLTGNVNSRYDKRRAEDIAESVSGVSNVENRLRVRQQSSVYTGATSSTGTTGTTGTTGATGTAGTQAGTPGTTTSSTAAGGTGTRGGRSTGSL